MPRKILLNLLTHLLLVGSVEGGEHLFGLSLLLALVPHHRDLVLQHLQSISYVYDLIWLKHFYLFVLRKENSPCSPPQSSEQAGKECRSSHWKKKKFQKNCKTDLCHILLADTFVLWTYLSDKIRFDFFRHDKSAPRPFQPHPQQDQHQGPTTNSHFKKTDQDAQILHNHFNRCSNPVTSSCFYVAYPAFFVQLHSIDWNCPSV